MNDDRKRNNSNRSLEWIAIGFATIAMLMGMKKAKAKKLKQAQKRRRQEEKRKQQRKDTIIRFILAIVAIVIGGLILHWLTKG
ncbi:MAG: hypothetical protein MJE68_13200 [Proteobacteria bacterium]|nr:hypothetical protein [Pseudomonadota bacterium]